MAVASASTPIKFARAMRQNPRRGKFCIHNSVIAINSISPSGLKKTPSRRIEDHALRYPRARRSAALAACSSCCRDAVQCRLHGADGRGRHSFPVGVCYPTLSKETDWTVGPYTLSTARDAAPAPGHFPLIVLSHGSGADQFHHRDWATYLSRHGFIVAAIKHAGDSLDDVGGRGSDVQLTGRSWQVKQTLNAVLADPRLKGIGMIGYSAGGYATLTTIGGRPDYALWGVHCKEHREDDELCPADGSWVPPRITRPGWGLPPPDPRIKAAVVMARAGILFDAKGLSGISIPLRESIARATIISCATTGTPTT